MTPSSAKWWREFEARQVCSEIEESPEGFEAYIGYWEPQGKWGVQDWNTLPSTYRARWASAERRARATDPIRVAAVAYHDAMLGPDTRAQNDTWHALMAAVVKETNR